MLIIFDMDNTLTESCQRVDEEMALLLNKLSEHHDIGIATGGMLGHVKFQVLQNTDFDCEVISVGGARADFIAKDGKEKNYWHGSLRDDEKQMIIDALEKLNKEFDIVPLADDQIQDRNSQITFSALGRSAPKDIKDTLDPDKRKRTKWLNFIRPLIPCEYSIKIGGTTSLDICRGYPDKGTAVRKLFKERLNEILYVGDSMFDGGNDSPLVGLVQCMPVENPEDTKRVINEILSGDI